MVRDATKTGGSVLEFSGEVKQSKGGRPLKGHGSVPVMVRPIYPPPAPSATVRSPSLPRVTLTDLVDLSTIEYSRREEDSEDGRERERTQDASTN